VAKILTYDAEFPFAVEEVFLTGVSKEYIEAKAPALGHEDAVILELEDGPDGGTARVRYTVESDLPGWAKKILPSRNTITESHSWPGPGSDGGRAYAFTVAVANVPVEIRGSVRLVAVSPTSCRTEARVEVKASLPLVGGKLEDLVAGDLRRTMEGEEAFMREWLGAKHQS
jgi:hypothetical protein